MTRSKLNRKSIHDSYQDGYTSGLKWTNNWKPGGPWVPSLGISPTEGRKLIVAQAEAEKKAWLEGWEDGYERSKHYNT